jgi:hypothetical protein
MASAGANGTSGPKEQIGGFFCGTLAPRGDQVTFAFQYAGRRDVYTFNVQAFPDDPAVLKNVGLKVFGPQSGKTYVNGGVQRGIVPNISGNLISSDPGAYVVVLSNFDANTPVSYQLWMVTSGPPSEARSFP